MSTINRILIPTDFSETAGLALAHGAKMAHLFNAKIYLLHAVESSVYAGSTGEPVMVPQLDNIFKMADQKLNEMKETIGKKYGLDITSLIISGKPASGIARAVKENQIDIIVMGTHGVRGAEEFFLGSNAHKVVNLAPCPVLTIQASATHIGFNNIVMPIDESLHSRQKVNNVIEIAKKYNSKVHILGLIQTDDIVDEKKLEIKLESAENLIVKANISYDKKMVKGRNLAEEALKYSEEVKGDLICIMTDHESDLTGMFLGAFAKQIVNHSKIPVLSIRPVETMIETFDPSGGTGQQ